MTRTESIDIVTDQNLEKHIHKHMGCMAGLFQIFDRNHILSGKRIYNNTKRLPPPSPEKSEKDGVTPALSSPSPVKEIKCEAKAKPKPALPVLELKEGTRSSWKFSREAPRLSLDSRAVVDAKGGLHPREIRTNATANLENDADKQRRSTSSVIVRLMGLDPLSLDSGAKLQRSASESRVPRDQFSEPKLKSNNYTQRSNVGSGLGQMNNHNHNHNHHRSNTNSNAVNVNAINNANVVNSYGNMDNGLWNGRGKQNKGTFMVQKKSFYNSADFFPEPKHNDSIYGEIEKRLKMRGINQPSQDLDTLKHILEALQLKGLLHSQNHNQSPIVLMKPIRSSSPSRFERFNRTGYESPPPHSTVRSSPRARRNLTPRVDDRAQVNSRNSSPTRRNVPNVETRRRVSNDGVDSRRVSPVNSPKISSRRNATAQIATGGSPRMRRVTDPKVKMLAVAEDEWSTVSENSFTTSNSHTDTEKYKLEEYREGRNLLDRCDKLLNSIAEITAANANELQPSPVSVLDSSFYKDEWCSPSPITKRCIDYNFKDQSAESEDDMWSAGEGKSEEATSEDCDFVYLSEILRASSYLPEDCDIFLLLEKQQFLKGKDTSKASTLQRRLVFDTLQEILNRKQRLPPWKAVLRGEETEQIWSEFRRIREREESQSEDLFGVICGVLKKDMAEEMSGWGEWTVELGDVVLDIERLIFKDLIGETIQDLASFAPQSNKLEALRRKLVF